VALIWHFGQLGDERNSEIAFGSPQVAQMRHVSFGMSMFLCRYRDPSSKRDLHRAAK
jgi:hypothetical protein